MPSGSGVSTKFPSFEVPHPRDGRWALPRQGRWALPRQGRSPQPVIFPAYLWAGELDIQTF